MATRATQKAEILTVAEALDFIECHGVVCESARRGAIPSLAEAIAGAAIRGNWWSHPKSREIFALTRSVRASAQVLVCRLIDGKITFVHERLWPALMRLADNFPHERLACVREVHSTNGKHVLEETPFPDWVPAKIRAAAMQITNTDAITALSMLDRVI